MKRTAAWLAGMVVLVVMGTAAPAQSLKDWPWNPLHNQRLPPEARRAIENLCGGSVHLGHYFATYSDGGRQLNLHFEDYHCDNGRGFCRGDECLHQTWHLRDGRFVLSRSFYESRNH